MKLVRSNDASLIAAAALIFTAPHSLAQLPPDAVNINATNKVGATPLQVAALHGKWDVVKLLLAQGADVNAKNEFGETALHMAAVLDRPKDEAEMLFDGHDDVTKLLLTKGAKVNAKSDDGDTPLHMAAIYGSQNVMRLLIRAGADLTDTNKDGNTPLHMAAMSPHYVDTDLPIGERRARAEVQADNHNDVTEILLVMGADVEATIETRIIE